MPSAFGRGQPYGQEKIDATELEALVKSNGRGEWGFLVPVVQRHKRIV